jgi:hypothetical protein
MSVEETKTSSPTLICLLWLAVPSCSFGLAGCDEDRQALMDHTGCWRRDLPVADRIIRTGLVAAG